MITDFRMPVMNGMVLLAWCQQNGVHLPVVLVTADADIIDATQVALGDCCATVLRKPVNPQGLAMALTSADQRVHHADCVHKRI